MNSITIAGNVGSKQELRSTPSGNTVISFSLADNRGKDKDAIWWKVTFWGKQAQVIDTFVEKGTFLVVSGEFEGNNKYQAGNGEWRDSLDIKGRQFMFGPRTDTAQSHSSLDVDFDSTEPVPF